MDTGEFTESLLDVMERKVHWGWPLFTSGKVSKDTLHLHFEQEYETYVRDFPVLIGRSYIQCPVAEARQELAENLFEEETGGLVAGKPHPELFLEYPKGLGMDLSRFQEIELLPAAKAYRKILDECTLHSDWDVGAAVSTIFVEGTPYERGELDASAPKRPVKPLEEHPLVVHYGLPLEALALTKAHRQVEGEHRNAAWDVVLHYVEPQRRSVVVAGMEKTLQAWLAYRDELCETIGLMRPVNSNQ